MILLAAMTMVMDLGTINDTAAISRRACVVVCGVVVVMLDVG